MIGVLILVLIAAGLSGGVAGAQDSYWSEEVVERVSRLPVQAEGRVKPFSTKAAFALLGLRGNRTLRLEDPDRALSPTEWLLDVMFRPETARDYPVFLVEDDAVLTAIGVGDVARKRRDRYSLAEIEAGLPKLEQLSREYSGIEDDRRTRLQTQVLRLSSRVNSYLYLQHALDWARADVDLEPGSRLSALFGGATTVTMTEVVGKRNRLRGRFTQLGDGAEGASEREGLSRLIRRLEFWISTHRFSERYPALIPEDAPKPRGRVPEQFQEWSDWESAPEVLRAHWTGARDSEEEWRMLVALERMAREAADPVAFGEALAGFEEAQRRVLDARGAEEAAGIGLEVAYYDWGLRWLSLYVSATAILAMAAMWLIPRSGIAYGSTWGMVVMAWLLLVGDIALRSLVRGRPPVTNLYETFPFIAAVGVGVMFVVEWITRRRIALSVAALLGPLLVILGNKYETVEGTDTMEPLIAVLDTNYWLATHVTTINMGYSAGFFAAFLGTLWLMGYLVQALRGRLDGTTWRGGKILVRMTYGVICFGVVFAVVGTILGGVWANDSWGRFWGWDPKENGALLICLALLAILHARMGGLIRDFGISFCSAFTGIIVAFSWFGTNLLQVGLHSYGFSEHLDRGLTTYYWIQGGLLGLGGLGYVIANVRAEEQQVRAADPTST